METYNRVKRSRGALPTTDTELKLIAAEFRPNDCCPRSTEHRWAVTGAEGFQIAWEKRLVTTGRFFKVPDNDLANVLQPRFIYRTRFDS